MEEVKKKQAISLSEVKEILGIDTPKLRMGIEFDDSNVSGLGQYVEEKTNSGILYNRNILSPAQFFYGFLNERITSTVKGNKIDKIRTFRRCVFQMAHVKIKSAPI